MQISDACEIPERPYLPACLAGLALGLVLVLTVVGTVHGLGATGLPRRLGAWLGAGVAPPGPPDHD